jgi:predicted protein tyrosine phosphatase
MIESVDFWPRLPAEDFPFSPLHAVISITDLKQEPARIAGAGDLLRLEFYDMTEPADDDPRFGPETLFSVDQARAVQELIARLQAQAEVRKVVVQCEAGVSRSAAIALFVEAATGCGFSTRDKAAQANRHVLRVLADVTGVVAEPPPEKVAAGGILLF